MERARNLFFLKMNNITLILIIAIQDEYNDEIVSCYYVVNYGNPSQREEMS